VADNIGIAVHSLMNNRAARFVSEMKTEAGRINKNHFE